MPADVTSFALDSLRRMGVPVGRPDDPDNQTLGVRLLFGGPQSDDDRPDPLAAAAGLAAPPAADAAPAPAPAAPPMPSLVAARAPSQSDNPADTAIGWARDRFDDAKDYVSGEVKGLKADAMGKLVDFATDHSQMADKIANGLQSSAQQAGSPAPAPQAVKEPDFTVLSRRHESGNGGPGTVSTGNGDPGGVSYGTFQLNTADGRVADFLASAEGAPWRARFGPAQPGTPRFGEIWRQSAAQDPVAFGDAQRAFIQRDYLDRQDGIIQRSTGLDMRSRSDALNNLIYATSVQHGQYGALVANVIRQLQRAHPEIGPDDAQIIEGISAERARLDSHGTPVHFRSSPPERWPTLLARVRAERHDALQMLQDERGQ